MKAFNILSWDMKMRQSYVPQLSLIATSKKSRAWKMRILTIPKKKERAKSFNSLLNLVKSRLSMLQYSWRCTISTDLRFELIDWELMQF